MHEKRAVSTSLEELYRVPAGLHLLPDCCALRTNLLAPCCLQAVEDMCLHKLAERVYTNLRQARPAGTQGAALVPQQLLTASLSVLQECQQHIGRLVAELASQGAMEQIVFLGQVWAPSLHMHHARALSCCASPSLLTHQMAITIQQACNTSLCTCPVLLCTNSAA